VTDDRQAHEAPSPEELEQFAAACNAVYTAIRRNRGRTEPGRDAETVTESQAKLLEPLAVHGAMPVGALARHVELAQPTVTRALKTLERAGVVIRGRSTGDERRVVAELTPHGHEVLRNTRQRLHDLQSAALELFPAEQRAQVITVLTDLAHAIKETSPR
jgi:MarR family transcriptional regulator, organic hydroperoxide resistance regulator